jgi:hypothetical protein
MPNHSTPIRTLVHALVGVLLGLGICAAPWAMADGEGPFTIASLQGTYAYVNNSGGVASFGPMIFDGKGGLTLKDKANLPCSDPAPSCARVIIDLTGDGTYTVNPDGTGAATITFTFSDGTVFSTDTFDFMISGTTKQGKTLLATQVFAADQAGGLAGQLVAPTWTRISN